MPRDSGDEKLRHELLEVINRYEDRNLVQIAWAEFETWDVGEDVKGDVRDDLVEAERQLDEQLVISREGRRRLRMFLFNRRLQERKRGSS
jgi:hypothetical protein